MNTQAGAVQSALLANLVTLLFAIVSLTLKRWLGLEWLVSSGYVNIILEILLIAVLVYGFEQIRQSITEAAGTLQTYPVLRTVVILLWLYAGLLLVMLLARLTMGAYSVPPHPGWNHLLSLPPETRPGFLLHYLLLAMFSAVLLGPIAEELLFVGANLRIARAAGMSRSKILVINAALFVLLHQLLAPALLSWTALLSYFIGRVLMDSLYFRTGSIVVPICFHILHNTVGMMLNLLPFL